MVALLPTKGNDTSETIFVQQKQLLEMARLLKIRVVAMSADGASSEIGAQALMDGEKSTGGSPLSYDYPMYGISLRAPVFDITGPLVSVQDPNHARKTCRNQPQHGTHTASLGRGYVVNRSLVALQETEGSGLVRRDVENVDKQDDGAARRLFHEKALSAMVSNSPEDEGVPVLKEEFRGLFVYCSIFGTLLRSSRAVRSVCV